MNLKVLAGPGSAPPRGRVAAGLPGLPGWYQPGPGRLFLSESRRNFAQPMTRWTWPKVVRQIALEAEVPQFSPHTLRHLCLTDPARAGWELPAIATFAGHRHTDSTLHYIGPRGIRRTSSTTGDAVGDLGVSGGGRCVKELL